MERREKWLGLVAQCFGGTTMVCLLFLCFIALTRNRIAGSELSLILMLPMPGVALLPLMALIGKGVLHCGFFEALELTAGSYGRGALLSVAFLAVASILCWLISIL